MRLLQCNMHGSDHTTYCLFNKDALSLSPSSLAMDPNTMSLSASFHPAQASLSSTLVPQLSLPSLALQHGHTSPLTLRPSSGSLAMDLDIISPSASLILSKVTIAPNPFPD